MVEPLHWVSDAYYTHILSVTLPSTYAVSDSTMSLSIVNLWYTFLILWKILSGFSLYLKGRERGKQEVLEGVGKRDLLCAGSVSECPQMPAKTGPSWTQQPRIQQDLCCGWHRPSYLSHQLMPLRGGIHECWAARRGPDMNQLHWLNQQLSNACCWAPETAGRTGLWAQENGTRGIIREPMWQGWRGEEQRAPTQVLMRGAVLTMKSAGSCRGYPTGRVVGFQQPWPCVGSELPTELLTQPCLSTEPRVPQILGFVLWGFTYPQSTVLWKHYVENSWTEQLSFKYPLLPCTALTVQFTWWIVFSVCWTLSHIRMQWEHSLWSLSVASGPWTAATDAGQLRWCSDSQSTFVLTSGFFSSPRASSCSFTQSHLLLPSLFFKEIILKHPVLTRAKF